MPPRITVLMPVYNGERFLRQAVESILAQSFKDYEFLIIDDGSTDGTADILDDFGMPSVIILRNDKNLGLTYSLNKGLNAAMGTFVARMDADDISEPARLEIQLAFLEANPEVGIVGSACGLIDEDGQDQGLSEVSLTDLDIRWRCLTGNPFQHSSVMFRKKLMAEHGLCYDETFETAQDYNLWRRLLNYTRGANIAEPLVSRRIHGGAVSVAWRKQQDVNHVRTSLKAISEVWESHPLTAETFGDLRELLSTFRPLPGTADSHRCVRLEEYAELLERFARIHEEAEGIIPLCRREAILVTFLALRPPWRWGVGRILGRLLRFEPELPRLFASWALRGAKRRLFNRKRRSRPLTNHIR